MIYYSVTYVVFPLLTGALILAFLRLLRGPSLADRIIAFDLIAVVSAGIIVVTAITTGHPVLLDAASIWAVIAFLSVIAFSWYIELKGGIF